MRDWKAYLVCLGVIVFVWGIAGGMIYCGTVAKASDRPAEREEIIIIHVTEYSHYVIDVRFNLCFYETGTVQGISVVSVQGRACDKMLGR